jgi:hypothetical protein
MIKIEAETETEATTIDIMMEKGIHHALAPTRGIRIEILF